MSTEEVEAQPAQAVEDVLTQDELTKSGVANAGGRAVPASAKYKEGQVVHMGVIQGGARVKGVFRIHQVFNRGGFVEYALKEEISGQLYRHGAPVREKDLKPQ